MLNKLASMQRLMPFVSALRLIRQLNWQLKLPKTRSVKGERPRRLSKLESMQRQMLFVSALRLIRQLNWRLKLL